MTLYNIQYIIYNTIIAIENELQIESPEMCLRGLADALKKLGSASWTHTIRTLDEGKLQQHNHALQPYKGGRVPLTEILLPRIARQGTAYLISKKDQLEKLELTNLGSKSSN